MRIERGVAVFDYRAKEFAATARRSPTRRSCPRSGRAPGRAAAADSELLAYREGRGWVNVRAAEINQYLKQVMGGDYTAKDFRTWNATVLTAVELAANGHDASTRRAQAGGERGNPTRRGAPNEHARGPPQRLHRPEGLRPLRLRGRRSAAR